MESTPAPHRLSAADAFAVLRQTFRDPVAGGRAYDAHVRACAKVAGAQRLLTLSDSDFAALAAEDIEIVVPGR